MTDKERMDLFHALAAAYNAFSRTLRERGYELGTVYSDNPHTQPIYKADRSPVKNCWPLGSVKIEWKLNTTERTED